MDYNQMGKHLTKSIYVIPQNLWKNIAWKKEKYCYVSVDYIILFASFCN